MDRMARIDVDQYHRMLDAGILREGEPIELLDGFLVYKDRSGRGDDPMTIGKRHQLVVKLLTRVERLLDPHGCHLQIQGAITLPPHHEPEPDGAIVRGQPRDYVDRHPGPVDVSSVIEVAESSLGADRTSKLAIYAAAGIPQFVLINLIDNRIELFEEPVPSTGRYQRSSLLGPGDAVPLHLGGSTRLGIPASDLLP